MSLTCGYSSPRSNGRTNSQVTGVRVQVPLGHKPFGHGAMLPVLRLAGPRRACRLCPCQPPRRWIVRRVQNVRFWLTLSAGCAVIAATCRRTWVPRSCRRPPDGCCSVRLGSQDCNRRIEGAGSVLEALSVSCSLLAGMPRQEGSPEAKGDVMGAVKNVVLVHGGRVYGSGSHGVCDCLTSDGCHD